VRVLPLFFLPKKCFLAFILKTVMANSYSQVSIHCVFAVKGRENVISVGFRDRLHSYMAGILKNDGAFPLAVGGWMDHVHVFFELPMTVPIADLMRMLKATSSKWINENGFVKGKFQWQEGYSAFSYAHSQRDAVIKYIMTQEAHHASKSFREEYMSLLKNFGVTFDDKYVFEFYDEE
jgi:putative transposase